MDNNICLTVRFKYMFTVVLVNTFKNATVVIKESSHYHLKEFTSLLLVQILKI